MPHYGHAHTVLAPSTGMLYAKETVALREVLISRRKPGLMIGPPPTGGTGEDDGDDQDEDGPRSRHLRALCACPSPFVIRASKKTLTETTVRCATCGEPFRAAAP